MSKKNKDTFLYVAIGLAALYLLNQNRQPRQAYNYYPNAPYAPPAPPRSNGQAFAQWVNSIMSIYGNVRELWQPGGPFYKERVSPEELQAINAAGMALWNS